MQINSHRSTLLAQVSVVFVLIVSATGVTSA